VFDQLPQSLPALAAIATLIAAGIGAVVAVVVAFVNAWASRRIAIDTAHREFRSELANKAIAATKKVLAQIHAFDQLHLDKDVDGWRKAAASMNTRGLPLQMDLRTPHDPVFAAALKLFRRRRGQFRFWIEMNREQIPAGGISVTRTYMMEAAEIVQAAAEAYVFNLPEPRKRAQRLLKEANPMPLKKRIDARLAMLVQYDTLEDEDDQEHEEIAPGP
jgi:hypothetical protein